MRWRVYVLALPALCFLATGCLSPVKNQVPLANNATWEKSTNTNDTKLIIFNTSGSLGYGLDGSGRINVRLNGQGVGQLNVHRYARLIVPKGKYDVELVHLDIAKFTSNHQMELTETESYLQIFATPTSNEAYLVTHLPSDFAQKFKSIPQP